MLKNMFKNIDKGIRIFESSVVGFGILSMTILIFINVILRYVFKNSWTWAEELGRYIMIWLTFIGASLCVRENIHVVMDAILNTIPAKIRKAMIVLIYLGSAIVSLYLGYLGWKYMYKVKEAGQFSTVMEFLPMWVVYLVMPIGGILMAKNYLHLVVLNLKSSAIIKMIKDGD